MSKVKNPADNSNIQPNQNDNKNQNDRTQEVDLPIPEKKNDDITTGNGEKPEKDLERAGRIDSEENSVNNEKERSFKTGFDINDKAEKERTEKRGNENEKLERDDATDPKTKDTKWQQDKMNEANNQQTSNKNTETEGNLKDKRNDSILDPPKTETYEKNQGENVGGQINKENYTHKTEEEKRDELNRKQKDDIKKSSEQN